MTDYVTNISNSSNLNTQLKLLCLSDAGATKNLMIYETEKDIIVVDCGVAFPDDEQLGIDLVIPDVTYLIQNKQKLRAFIITHAHDDHYGAIPYIIEELNVPIYSNALVREYLMSSIEDRKGTEVLKSVDFRELEPDTPQITIGDFKINAFHTNHSVPDTLGLAIRTPQGLILHIADFKIDEDPVIDKPFDFVALQKYADEGVLCLLSDCLGADSPGDVDTERSLDKTFDEIFKRYDGRQLLITTISSNVSRMRQIVDAAIKHNRKVVFVGRSIIQKGEIAMKLGYLPNDKNRYVSMRNAPNENQADLVYIIAGCFGQPNSGLGKFSRDELKGYKIERSCVVVFSSEANPPGTDVFVERLMHDLTEAGVELLYPGLDPELKLHVSGHGHREELKRIAGIVKPKYFIPIGGENFKMRAYTHMIEGLGYTRDKSFELKEGDNLIFDGGVPKKGETIKVKQVYIDGNRIGTIGSVVINDRQRLADDGVFVIVVPISKKTNKVAGSPEIITRGFIYVKVSQELMADAKNIVKKTINKHSKKDWGTIKRKIEYDMESYLFKQTQNRPLIIVHGITI